MSKPSVLKNYIYSVLYQALVLVTPLVTTPYITRTLGDVSLGAYSWTQSICTYFMLTASLGIALYGQREVAYVRDDPERRVRVFRELFLFRLITVTASILPYIVLFSLHGAYHMLFLIQGLDLIAIIFDISWYLQGMENFKAVVGRNAAVKLISVACIFLFVKKPEDIGIYALCQSGSVFAGNLSLWIYLPAYNRGIRTGKLRLKKHILPVLLLFLPQIAIQVYNEMDKTMLGFLSPNISEGAYYTQAQKITKVAQAVVKAAGTVMLPRISYIFSYEGEEEAGRAVQKMFRYAVMLGTPMAAGIIGITENLVPWFLGSRFLASRTVLYLLAPAILLVSMSNVSGIQCLIPMKKQKAFNASVIAGACVNLVVNTLLIPGWGAAGASIGTLLSEFLVLCIQLWYLRHMIRIRALLWETWRYLAASLFMMAVLLFVSSHSPSNPAVTLSETAGGALLYTGMLLLFRDPLMLELKSRIAGIVKKKKTGR